MLGTLSIQPFPNPTPANTAKVHSPLYLQLVNDRIWQAESSQSQPSSTRSAIIKKRLELRKKNRESKKARKVFDELNNIYTAKRYKPKMFPPNGDTQQGPGFKEDLNNILCCPDCKEIPPNLIEEFSSGDMVCESCGIVVGARIIDNRSEWRTFANDDQAGDDPSRVGGTQDAFVDGEALHTSVAYGDTKSARVLSRIQNQTTADKGQKNLMEGYKQIVAYCETINMGQNVTNAAKHIFKLVDKHKILKGKPQEAIIAGCIFIACRQNNVGRTFREIYNLTAVSKKEVGRVFKALQNFLQKIQETEGDGAVGLNTVTNYENRAAEAEDLVQRYVSYFGFKEQQKITRLSKELCTVAKKYSKLVGRSPLSVAACCIYMACHLCGEPRTAQEISKFAGVSDGTVKNSYKYLYAVKDTIWRDDWKKFGASLDRLPYAAPLNSKDDDVTEVVPDDESKE